MGEYTLRLAQGDDETTEPVLHEFGEMRRFGRAYEES